MAQQTPTSLPFPLSEAVIRQHTSSNSFTRGREYYNQDRVTALTRRDSSLAAEVQGSEPVPYHVRVQFEPGGVGEATCTCLYPYGDWCKHIVAALLTALHQPDAIAERPSLESLLAPLDRDQLQQLVLHLVERAPDLAELVDNQVSLLTRPVVLADRGDAGRHPPVDPDAYRRRIRAILYGEATAAAGAATTTSTVRSARSWSSCAASWPRSGISFGRETGATR